MGGRRHKPGARPEYKMVRICFQKCKDLPEFASHDFLFETAQTGRATLVWGFLPRFEEVNHPWWCPPVHPMAVARCDHWCTGRRATGSGGVGPASSQVPGASPALIHVDS